jgi:hypothetical protein
MSSSPMNMPPLNAPSANGGNGRPIPTDPDELRRDIAETRERLGDTVEALSHKVDVKAQARERFAAGKESARESAGEARERLVGLYAKRPAVILGAGGAALLALITWIVLRRRR